MHTYLRMHHNGLRACNSSVGALPAQIPGRIQKVEPLSSSFFRSHSVDYRAPKLDPLVRSTLVSAHLRREASQTSLHMASGKCACKHVRQVRQLLSSEPWGFRLFQSLWQWQSDLAPPPFAVARICQDFVQRGVLKLPWQLLETHLGQTVKISCRHPKDMDPI